MSGRGEWLPWRRDWSKTPNVWKVYVAYSVLFGLVAVFYLAAGKLIGLFWVALALTWVFITSYVRRRSRPGPQPGKNDHQPT